MQAGQGPGLSLRDLGETAGEQTFTLLQTEMPPHAHGVQCIATGGLSTPGPANTWSGGLKGAPPALAATAFNNVQMNPFPCTAAGGNLPHTNMHPFLGRPFIT